MPHQQARYAWECFWLHFVLEVIHDNRTDENTRNVIKRVLNKAIFTLPGQRPKVSESGCIGQFEQPKTLNKECFHGH